ncbi:hypothetical protein ACFUV2_09275 [Streptomyces pilosus]|uniref:hypothetical protein n=1 Tax=Streptomyces pilosus TaxID=28893 RepID=UPI003637266B
MVEEQSQLLEYSVENLWRVRLIAPGGVSSQHGQGWAFGVSRQPVQTCLNEPVRPDVPAKYPFTRDVSEVIEGIVDGHNGLLHRHLLGEGLPIR